MKATTTSVNVNQIQNMEKVKHYMFEE